MKSIRPPSVAIFLPPANKVCEGYVLTGVCLSTEGCLSWGRGVSVQVGGSLSRGSLSLRGHMWRGVSVHEEGLCPGGWSVSGGWSLSRGVSVWGVSVQGGLRPGGSLSGRPPCSPCSNKHVVRVLLECILVYDLFLQGQGRPPQPPPNPLLVKPV